MSIALERAFVADGEMGLTVVPLGEPGESAFPAGWTVCPRQLTDVAVAGTVGYVSWNLPYEFGVDRLDLAAEGEPVVTGSFSVTGMGANGLAVANGLVFLACNDPGLLILGEGKGPLAQVGYLETDYSAADVSVDGQIACLALRAQRFWVVSIAHPAHPVLLSSLILPADCRGVCVAGAFAYAACGQAGVVVIDLRNPASPAIMATLDTPGEATGVFVKDDLAFVADGPGGLTVADVSDPSAPVWMATIPLPGNAEDVCFDGGVACVALGDAGLGILGVPVIVNPGGTGDYERIQDALDAMEPGGTVLLTDGVYYGVRNRELDFHGKPGTLRSISGKAEACIIDCQGTLNDPIRGIWFHSGETATSIVRDLTIRHGFASPVGILPQDDGERVLMGSGGGILIENGSSPLLQNVIIDENAATAGAGGVHCGEYSAPVLIDCTIRNNSATAGGGGVHCGLNSSPTFTNCRIENNTSGERGGGLFAAGAEVTLTNCIVDLNTAVLSGGGVACDSASTAVILNNTFYGNDSPEGSGMWAANGSLLAVDNTIISYGVGGEAVTLAFTGEDASSIDLGCSDVYGSEGGDYVGALASWFGVAGNISADPLFADVGAGNFALLPGSPCTPYHNESSCDLIGALGVVSATGVSPGVVQSALRLSAQPNPFNPVTVASFELLAPARVTLRIYDLAGRAVRRLLAGEPLGGGRHEVAWDGRDDSGRSLAAGVYLMRLEAGGERAVRRLALVK